MENMQKKDSAMWKPGAIEKSVKAGFSRHEPHAI